MIYFFVVALCPYVVEGTNWLPRACFISMLIPLVRSLPSWLNCLPKASLPHTITTGNRFSVDEFWKDTHFQTLATVILFSPLQYWCWERLRAGGEGGDKGWDGWMASPTQWTWVWVNSGSWWWTGRPGVLQSMGLQRVRYDWVNWEERSRS